jgi:predicted neutral ceramidase superfamily lipid hydrolase
LLERYAAEAISDSRNLDFNVLKVGFSHIPGENLERGIGPGGVRAAVFENEIGNTKELTGILLWDANGLAPGMNEELQNKLEGKVGNLLISTTDNHFVNIKPGGFNPLSDSEGILPSAIQVLDEAISDISEAESAMGTVYVDGVEIMGQGKQDKISAAANSIIEVARYSWLPIYSSATMFCMIASSYI